jgi:hypothetical protein
VTSGVIGWSLAAIGAIWGVLAFLAFRRFTDRAALRRVTRRLYAHLLELRLFSDEPALVWQAQKALIVDNAHFLARIALPVLIMAVPFALLYPQLDAIYGAAPLEVGHSAIVTAQLSHELEANDAQYVLEPPPGIAVETPPVRDFADRQVSWQIRALKPVRGQLQLRLPGGDVARSIAAGDRTLSPNRRRESPGTNRGTNRGTNLPGAVWVEVDYPRTDVAIVGLSLPWLAWFLIVSAIGASVCYFTAG